MRIGELVEVELQKLQLAENDICVLRYPDTTSVDKVRQFSTEMRQWLDTHEYDGVLFLAIPKGHEISAMSEEAMASQGWHRDSVGTPS